MTVFYDRLKKNYQISLFFSACLLITSIIFVVLFVNQKQINQQKYQKIFIVSMTNATSLFQQCTVDEFDYDTKYREITAEMNVCREMAFLIDMTTERQKTLNQLYYACIKLPKQIKLNMSELAIALNQITNNEDDSGYAQLKDIVDKFDDMDYGLNSN